MTTRLADDNRQDSLLAGILDAVAGGAAVGGGGGSTGGLTDAELRATPVAVSGTVACTGSFYQTTQPVSGAFYPATQPVSGTFWQATQPVSGTFWQATQPVSGPATDAQLRATPLPVSGAFYQATQPVSGTFWQATQPVSGTVTVNLGLTDTQLRATPVPVSGTVACTGTFYQATQPVSGTFWQATQPVSGPLTDTQIRATALPVSGTFFQATQPVSGTFWQATQPVSGPLTDTQIRATALPVSGTFWQATQPISAASLPLPAGAATAALQAIPTLTKGSQGATGYSVQDLKDSGRVLKTFTVSGLAAVSSEALIQLTPYADLSAGSAATTFAVTSGKRLRIQRITLTVRCTSTVNVGGLVRLRMLAGTVLVGSPVQDSIGCMGSNLATAVVGNAQSFSIEYPDGLELSGTMQFGLTQLFSTTTATIDVHVTGYEY